jgi:hypothetical protein
MKLIRNRRFVALVATLALAVTAVAGYAYFTSTGTGSGSATVGTSTTWQVNTLAATGGPLTPAGPSETVGYTVKNNSSGQQALANVAVKVANADGTTWVPTGLNAGCSASDFSISGAGSGATFNDTAQAANLASGATATGSVTIQMLDSLGNQDNCKNAIVPLYLSAS